jgi:hypothetical protein
MKVYFVGSVSGKEKYESNYQRIVDTLKKSAVSVIEFTLKPTVTYIHGLSDEDKVDHYKEVLKAINDSDVVLAEGSYPSFGVGYEISLAIEKGKPVVVLYEEGHSPHLIEGLKSEKLLVIKYKLNELESVVEDSIEYAADVQDTRFNFFISSKHQNYLDWIARVRKVPRAVHLRRLLERDMASNKSYQENLSGGRKRGRPKKKK